MDQGENLDATATEEEEVAIDTVASQLRVKVYEMTDSGNWDDKGTGHVTCSFMVCS